MKKSNLLIPVVFLTLIMLFSCKKTEDAIESITNEETADMVAYGISENSAGLAVTLEDAAELATETAQMLKSSMNELTDTSFTLTNPTGSVISYNFFVHYSYGFEISGQLQQFYLDFNSIGNYNAPRAASNDTTSASLTITGVGASDDLTINGSGNRRGTFSSKILNKNAYYSKINFVIDDVTISPGTLMLTGGKINMTIDGKDNNGRGFVVTGVLTFLGNYRAELDINSYKYIVNIDTGEVDPV